MWGRYFMTGRALGHDNWLIGILDCESIRKSPDDCVFADYFQVRQHVESRLSIAAERKGIRWAASNMAD